MELIQELGSEELLDPDFKAEAIENGKRAGSLRPFVIRVGEEDYFGVT
jgi:hypothetical protein